MRAISAPLAFVTILFFMGGCAQPPTSAPDDGIPDIFTDSPGRRPLAEVGSEIHVHDYWGTQMELVIIEKTFEQLRGTAPVGESGYAYVPPDGVTVLTGSKWMNVTSRWSSDSPLLRGVALGFRDAKGDVDEIDLPRDGTVILDLREESNDPPHSAKSLWRFQVWVQGGPSFVDVDLTITISRDGSPLPMAPAHPDAWIGLPTTELYNGSGPLFELLGAGTFVQPGNQPPRNLTGNLPVPWETAGVDAVLYYNASGPGAVGLSPLLSWKGADKTPWEHERVAPQRNGGPTSGTIQWNMDVEPRMWDSPYATASQWGFAFDWDGDSGSSPPRGGTEAVVASGDYRLVVTARREAGG